MTNIVSSCLFREFSGALFSDAQVFSIFHYALQSEIIMAVKSGHMDGHYGQTDNINYS